MNDSERKKWIRTQLLRYIGKPSPIEEMRRTFYRVIIVDMFWIDVDLPNDPDKKFEFVINPHWEESSNPNTYFGLTKLSEDMLIYVSSRFKRPDWVDKPDTIKVEMSLNEIVKQWPMLFDLEK